MEMKMSRKEMLCNFFKTAANGLTRGAKAAAQFVKNHPCFTVCTSVTALTACISPVASGMALAVSSLVCGIATPGSEPKIWGSCFAATVVGLVLALGALNLTSTTEKLSQKASPLARDKVLSGEADHFTTEPLFGKDYISGWGKVTSATGTAEKVCSKGGVVLLKVNGENKAYELSKRPDGSSEWKKRDMAKVDLKALCGS